MGFCTPRRTLMKVSVGGSWNNHFLLIRVRTTNQSCKGATQDSRSHAHHTLLCSRAPVYSGSTPLLPVDLYPPRHISHPSLTFVHSINLCLHVTKAKLGYKVSSFKRFNLRPEIAVLSAKACPVLTFRCLNHLHSSAVQAVSHRLYCYLLTLLSSIHAFRGTSTYAYVDRFSSWRPGLPGLTT